MQANQSDILVFDAYIPTSCPIDGPGDTAAIS